MLQALNIIVKIVDPIRTAQMHTLVWDFAVCLCLKTFPLTWTNFISCYYIHHKYWNTLTHCHTYPKFVADDIHFFFSEKTSLDISCESSAKQTIHMKCQDLFSLKIKKKKKKKMSSAVFVTGTLRVKSCCMSVKKGRFWSDATLCGIWSRSTLFGQASLS